VGFPLRLNREYPIFWWGGEAQRSATGWPLFSAPYLLSHKRVDGDSYSYGKLPHPHAFASIAASIGTGKLHPLADFRSVNRQQASCRAAWEFGANQGVVPLIPTNHAAQPTQIDSTAAKIVGTAAKYFQLSTNVATCTRHSIQPTRPIA